MRLLLFALCPLLTAFSAEPPNMLLGTQAIGGRYQFTQDEPLLESAKLIAELGSGIMKFSISKQASFGKAKANVRESNPGLKTLTEIAEKEPTHRAVLDMPFTHFFIWAYPFTTHGSAGTFKTAERNLEYREMFDLTAHLLRTYSGSGKKFYLGHWEGDWHLRPHFDPKQPFPEHFGENFIAWLKLRQQAIFAGADDGIVYSTFHEMAAKNKVAYDFFSTRPAELLGKELPRWKKRLEKGK